MITITIKINEVFAAGIATGVEMDYDARSTDDGATDAEVAVAKSIRAAIEHSSPIVQIVPDVAVNN